VDGEGLHDDEVLVLRLIRTGSLVQLERSGLVGVAADAEQIAQALTPLWDSSSVSVTEIRVNGTRVDVRLESGEGRAWLAVLWMEGGPSTAVLEATLYERPPMFQGRPSGLVVVLNGPSSVGKSSLMKSFVDMASTPWACLDEPAFGRLAAKYLAWPATAGPMVEGVLAALAAAAAVGNQFVVSAAGVEQHRFRHALVGVPTVYVGLDAPLRVLLERQVTQADKFGGLAEESVGIHDGWVYDLRIDTASCGSSEAARLLVDFLDADANRRSGVIE
jgi:Chloramphenicol 3-O-phosphotransferase